MRSVTRLSRLLLEKVGVLPSLLVVRTSDDPRLSVDDVPHFVAPELPVLFLDLVDDGVPVLHNHQSCSKWEVEKAGHG